MNKIWLRGIVKDVKFAYKKFDESFYCVELEVERFSGTNDSVNCIVPELFISLFNIGEEIGIEGEVRTKNEFVNGKSRLSVYVFVEKAGELDGSTVNYSEIEGIICRKPTLRETPKGRVISDFMIAVNRQNARRTDYIPFIAWGRTAERLSLLELGTKVKVNSRIQSREYTKVYENGSIEARRVIEMSTVSFCEVDENGCEN